MGGCQLNPILTIQTDLPEKQLLWTNSPTQNTTWGWEPTPLRLRLHLEGNALTPRLRLEAGPNGTIWGRATVEAAELADEYSLDCRLYSKSHPPGPLEVVVRVIEDGAGRVVAQTSLTLDVVWEGHSGFDPARHGYDFVNSGSAYGAVRLDRAVFEQTYGLTFERDNLFRKMYRDILGATEDANGPIAGTAPLSSGLCTGMIRSALEYYRQGASPLAHDRQPNGDTLTTIKLFHGRQLTDRALFQAAGWIVLGGPRKVFEAFKKEVLRGNLDPMAFDIGIATLKRKDFFRAVQAEGHTTIPYAFRQTGPYTGQIFIYNPNIPASQENYGYANAPLGQERRLAGPVINFDLAKNTYYYTDHYQSLRPNGDPTTIVAVHQSAYEKGRNALIASIANKFI